MFATPPSFAAVKPIKAFALHNLGVNPFDFLDRQRYQIMLLLKNHHTHVPYRLNTDV